MKTSAKILLLLIFTAATGTVFSQTTLERYFSSTGVYHLCQAAHASNDYLSGTYDINSAYVDVAIESRDNVFGATVHTDIRVVRGVGDLYFSDLIVKSDDDMVKPFEAFGLKAALLVELMKAIGPDTYNKTRQAIRQEFNTDFEYWTPKMWALLAMNLDYYDYVLSSN